MLNLDEDNGLVLVMDGLILLDRVSLTDCGHDGQTGFFRLDDGREFRVTVEELPDVD